MRVFVAGASGVLGVRIVPLLVASGHSVCAMTRSSEKVDLLSSFGAEPTVVNVFDTDALQAAVAGFCPDAVIHELTDLPDDRARIAEFALANNRIRREGTRNLLAAAKLAGATVFIAQSVAWELHGDGGVAAAELERTVLAAHGVVVRYGQLYGPGTYYESGAPPPPCIHVDEAARRTVPLLGAPSGVVTLVEE